MRHKTVLRVGLSLLGLSLVGVGAWALFAPMSFQNDFPGMGRHWLPPLGPYNEHLITDVGATFLALSVLMFLAALWLTTRLVQAALIAWLVYSVPHLYFHLNNLSVYDASDQVANGVALSGQVLLGAGLLVLSFNPENKTEV
ncbi:MAG: hypothetical protein QOG62_1545 [Thermoleophilaceae bacterium]|jgi:hypothetical protein|nr:hypothetical protein [Thermoleophilaceae bacterium]